MIKLQNVLVLAENVPFDAKALIAKRLNLSFEKIKSAEIIRRSLDVRKKYSPYFCYTFLVDFFDKKDEKFILKTQKSALPYEEVEYKFLKAKKSPKNRPIIIGSGPAGLFAAITFIKAGLSPLIIERGKSVDDRILDIEIFRNGGKLLPHSNVQFGEGGAGTFSDGKLNTGIKDIRINTVLKLFAEFGADPDILINAKPHIGTDVLQLVVKNMRNFISENGGEYMFETAFKRPVTTNNKLKAIVCERDGAEFSIDCDHLILAIGNAARDTFRVLYENRLDMAAKPFAVGVRIEHLQENLNLTQYGEDYPTALPPCEYKLAVHTESGRGVYTFCMCPGGVVVNATSEENSNVTNGMSYHARSGKNANSALLVGVTPEDFGSDPLDGIDFQIKIEKAAFKATGGYSAPCQTVGSFLYGDKNIKGEVEPSILPAPTFCDLDKILPDFVITALKEALPLFERKISGFASSCAILTAPETRSSSPVKIIRNDLFESNIEGIFPAGEGAGYAGGITSSAVDGIKVAEAVINKINL